MAITTYEAAAGERRRERRMSAGMFAVAILDLLAATLAGSAEATIVIDSDVRYVSIAVTGQDAAGPINVQEQTDHTGLGGAFDESLYDPRAEAQQQSQVDATGILGDGHVASDEYLLTTICDQSGCYDDYALGTAYSIMTIDFHVDSPQAFELSGFGFTSNVGAWLSLGGGLLDIRPVGDGFNFLETGLFQPGTSYTLDLRMISTGYDTGDFSVNLVMVPEPATGMLLGLGLVGLAGARHRADPGRGSSSAAALSCTNTPS